MVTVAYRVRAEAIYPAFLCFSSVAGHGLRRRRVLFRAQSRACVPGWRHTRKQRSASRVALGVAVGRECM